MKPCLIAAIFAAAVMPITAQPARPGDAPTAVIHVYRQKHVCAFAYSPSVYIDGTEIKRLRNGSFFVATVPTGKHMITAGRTEVGLLVEFEPGKDYYFKLDHKNCAGSAFSGRPPMVLSAVSPEQAKTEMSGLKER